MSDADPSHGATPPGQAPWVTRVVAEQRGPLTRYAARLLGDPDQARDVVQDTFAKLLIQPPGLVDGHPVEWLFTVCRHRALDLLRQKRTAGAPAEAAVETVASAEPHPAQVMERRENHATLLRLIDRLPAPQQEVVRLKFQNGFSYREISRITDLTVTNVGFILHTALARLRREWAAAEAS